MSSSWRDVVVTEGELYRGWTMIKVYSRDYDYIFHVLRRSKTPEIRQAAIEAICHKDRVDPYSVDDFYV
jgi:hypothetical protein